MSDDKQTIAIQDLGTLHFQLLPKYFATYSKRAFPQQNWALNYIQKLDLKGLARIVDAGCRNGIATMELAVRNPEAHVIGIDNSIPLLEMANENLAKHTLPNLEFRLMDPLRMDFQGKIDAVVSISFLHWVSDKFALLQAIRSSLRHGGKAYFSFFADHQRKRFDRCFTNVMQYEKWQPYFSEIPLGCMDIQTHEWADLAYRAGFVLDKLEFVEVQDVFNSKEEFMDWLTTWVVYLKYLPEELHYPFLSDAVENYLEVHPMDSAGLIHRKDYMLETVLLNIL